MNSPCESIYIKDQKMQTTVTEMEWGVREGGKDRIIKGCEGLMEVTDLVTIWIVVMKSLVV